MFVELHSCFEPNYEMCSSVALWFGNNNHVADGTQSRPFPRGRPLGVFAAKNLSKARSPLDVERASECAIATTAVLELPGEYTTWAQGSWF